MNRSEINMRLTFKWWWKLLRFSSRCKIEDRHDVLGNKSLYRSSHLFQSLNTSQRKTFYCFNIWTNFDKLFRERVFSRMFYRKMSEWRLQGWPLAKWGYLDSWKPALDSSPHNNCWKEYHAKCFNLCESLCDSIA